MTTFTPQPSQLRPIVELLLHSTISEDLTQGTSLREEKSFRLLAKDTPDSPTTETQPPNILKGGNHALQDYQMQLMLLEQQNKKRLMMARQEQDAMMLPLWPPSMELPNNKTDYAWEQVATVAQNKRAVDEGDSEAQDYTGDESLAQVLPGKRRKTVRSRATSSRADCHNGNAHLEASSASFGQLPPAGTSAKAFVSPHERNLSIIILTKGMGTELADGTNIPTALAT